MPTSTFRTLDSVVGGLAALETQFRERHDRRAIFATLYGIVSAEMERRIARGAFLDNEWVHRYAVAFANYYRDALDAYDNGDLERVPKAWRLAFDAARAGTGLVLQDLLLGVNAHVNNDLPLALHTIAIHPDRERRYRDHTAVNQVLAEVTERATLSIAAAYAPGLTALDQCAGQVDELLSAFSLDIARESAWEGALSLTNARNGFERALVTRLIAARASAMARLLLAPSSQPVLMGACRRLEQGIDWTAFIRKAATPRTG